MGSLPTQRRLRAESVCIIGAGPSGLAAAKYLLAEHAFSRIAVFEQRSHPGGLWNYSPRPATTPLPVPQTDPHPTPAAFVSPVYDSLETNLPKDLMRFSDLDWPSHNQLFPKHSQVLEYLQRYADDVHHLISFNTQVLHVRQQQESGWLVETQHVSPQGELDTVRHVFDAVIVASGHYAVPYVPAVEGIEAWNRAYPGAITHSTFYRNPESYAGKKVVVVGNSASGIDIGTQIAAVCRKPLLQSQKSESYLSRALAPGKSERPEITEYIVSDRSVRFKDGTIEAEIDAVLYCTGYFFAYPFLQSLDPPLVTTGHRVEKTYQHIFYQSNPTLAILGLTQKVIPFPVAEAQSAVVARVYAGRLSLPSEAEMLSWEREVVAEMGDGKGFHVLQFPKDAEYINLLHDWAGSADERVLQDGLEVGKTPPYWSEREHWMRERFAAIKKAFQEFGEERHHKRTLDDVGYSFDKWHAERAQEQSEL
ncbi:flavin-dependent monooxygenase [Lecanosticta acicola]|uniref:Flavin-dependent monooxygenase n=1 Tax=Lecanosticta acicola TaxID=111012 RepID=A0AAI8YYT1_9PEZI|nr:flavin-dependent monooxygenase [Lecanosticta acicola]